MPTCMVPQGRIERKIYKGQAISHLAATGSYLSSQAVSNQVLSAYVGLTTVFGMGTGGSPQLSPPDGFDFRLAIFDFRRFTKVKCLKSIIELEGLFLQNFTEEDLNAISCYQIGCSSLALGTKRFAYVCASLSLLQTWLSAYKSSPRLISTSQLHPLLNFHTWPIYLVVYKEPYRNSRRYSGCSLREFCLSLGFSPADRLLSTDDCSMRDLILRPVSRLDAFSVYPFRT